MASQPQQSSKNFLSDYRSVNQRIQEFYGKYPDGRIVTNLIESISNVDAGTFAVRTELFRSYEDAQPFATGIAIETPTSGYVNKQGFALENAETSSIGRALQNAGIATKASDIRPEEMARLERAGAVERTSQGSHPSQPGAPASAATKPTAVPRDDRPASNIQKTTITDLCAKLIELGIYPDRREAWQDVVDMHPQRKARLDDWSEAEAAHTIKRLNDLKGRAEELRGQRPPDDEVSI